MAEDLGPARAAQSDRPVRGVTVERGTQPHGETARETVERHSLRETPSASSVGRGRRGG
ncbi:hypothetical protein GA0115245_131717 [Streptomyces sp. di188]|nr:hypothetical protein GA0115238_142417 [Streptomyces sp. di50b]SCE34530.1 hypothetical protein GA0115245_131717 [Streptomyces sp. di188]